MSAPRDRIPFDYSGWADDRPEDGAPLGRGGGWYDEPPPFDEEWDGEE